jgi:hypothetical protein
MAWLSVCRPVCSALNPFIACLTFPAQESTRPNLMALAGQLFCIPEFTCPVFFCILRNFGASTGKL